MDQAKNILFRSFYANLNKGECTSGRMITQLYLAGSVATPRREVSLSASTQN
jgi:hypothetical protein